MTFEFLNPTGHDLGAVAGADTTAVFVEGDLPHPLQPVLGFTVPQTSAGTSERCWRSAR
jgi:hypothetical protein